jgi:integrase
MTDQQPRLARESFEWDDEVIGLARRVRANGTATWIVQSREKGRTVRRTLGRADALTLDDARAAARRVREIDTPPDVTPTVTAFAETALRDCAGQWKPRTLVTHEWCVRRIAATSLGALPVNRVTRQHVANWLSEHRRESARHLAVLSFVMGHAETKGLRAPATNPCKGLRRKRSTFVARYLTLDEYPRLFGALSACEETHPNETAFIRFLAFTGARFGEALGLTWEQVDSGRAVLRDSKTGPKTLWLSREALAVLDGLPRGAPGAFTFAPNLTRHSCTARVRKVWKRTLAHAALGPLRLHDLRHSFASVGASIGLDLRILAGLLGHADFSSTMCYAHLGRAPVGDAAERVSRRLAKALRPTERVTPLRPPAEPSSRRPDRPMRRHVLFSSVQGRGPLPRASYWESYCRVS